MTPELQAVLARAARSPFYRSRGLPADFADAPVTTKDDLRAAYPFGLLAAPRENIATYHESSGTSGNPISSYFTDRDWNDVVTRFLRSDVRLNSSDMVMVKTPYALVTTAHQMHLAARAAGATVVPADNRSHNMPYVRVVRLLRDLPITVAWCLPTEVQIWAFVARRLGLSPEKDFPLLRAFLVAGEALSPARKRQLSKIWGGKRVIEDYGSTETGSLAGECAFGRLHLWDDRLHFEVRDGETFRSRGTGSLVVTPLYREAMPIVRYDLGDAVTISDETCACGSKHATVEIAGRGIAEGFRARDLEELVYSGEDDVIFWRARREDRVLNLEIAFDDVAPGAESRTQQRLEEELRTRVSVRAVAAETFFPASLLAAEAPMQKPRFLFEANEDWNKALTYA